MYITEFVREMQNDITIILKPKVQLVSMPFYEISMYRNMKLSCCFGSIDMVGCTPVIIFDLFLCSGDD